MRAPLLQSLIAILALTAPALPADGPRYVALAFHDVVDDRSPRDDDAVTAANLIAFFEWMRANQWTAITLDDIAHARDGHKPLPARAVLITFDDGYRSLYTRVFPLLLAYRIPIVAALVGSWVDAPEDATVLYDGKPVPRSRFLSWDQAREMARSGLVEFASHGYDLHRSHLANPQGNQLPVAASLAYREGTGYESAADYRQRIRADLDRMQALLQRELGKPPRAIVWPFGRYTEAAQLEAKAADFEFLLTLDPEPGFPQDLPVVHRLIPVHDPNIGALVDNLLFRVELSPAVRITRLNPALFPTGDPAAFDRALGRAIERIRRLGASHVVIDAGVIGASGALESVWFPNRALPVKADVLNRLVWQMRTRAGVQVAVSLPHAAARAALPDEAAVLHLFEDLGFSAMADALFLEQAPALASVPVEPGVSSRRWDVRHRRNSLDPAGLPAGDALALRAFGAFEHVRPGCLLLLLAPSPGQTPSSIADLTLVETTSAAFPQLVDRLDKAGWFSPGHRFRSGVWIRGSAPPSARDLSVALRLYQRRGGVAFGWEPDNPLTDEPKAAAASLAISAASFPVQP